MGAKLYDVVLLNVGALSAVALFIAVGQPAWLVDPMNAGDRNRKRHAYRG